MRLILNTHALSDYATFLRVKELPIYDFEGHTAVFPDEYAALLGGQVDVGALGTYTPHPSTFDYEAAICRLAIAKRKFAIFADCGLGKTFMLLEWAKYVSNQIRGNLLIVSPLMVIPQTIAESEQWYNGAFPIEQVASSNLQSWLDSGTGVGITNYDAMTQNLRRGRLAAMILDESSMLKSHYGKWGHRCLELGNGLQWKLCCTATPAPNDRIEYANHAVFMDAFPSVNAFLARFFVNRGQTGERWELKQHALTPFYRALSHWCIFLANPATYGWKDNALPLPPIETHFHQVGLTTQQRDILATKTDSMFYDSPGGITRRGTLAQIAKGHYKGARLEAHKPAMIRALVDSWPNESTLIWCLYNAEQDRLAEAIPEAASIKGDTPNSERQRIISDFKAGKCRVVISKSKILGFGLNLQRCTRMVFSSLQDSYESYYQAIKRANRYGATSPLHVHVPYTDPEYPMIQNVLRKAANIDADTKAQEELFHEFATIGR